MTLNSLNEREIKRLIGSIGEELVNNHFSVISKMNEDWYDDKSDSTVLGRSVEIKTSTILDLYQEYWIDASQLDKVRNVDMLIIVDIPIYKLYSTIYMCPNNSKLRTVTRQRFGNDVDVIAIPEKKLLPIGIAQNERVDLLIDLADIIADYRRKLRNINYESTIERVYNRLKNERIGQSTS